MVGSEVGGLIPLSSVALVSNAKIVLLCIRIENPLNKYSYILSSLYGNSIKLIEGILFCISFFIFENGFIILLFEK